MLDWRETFRVLFARRVVLFAALILLTMVVMAILCTWVLPYEPMAMKVSQRLKAPNWSHWSGTDELGRDITSRIFYGARYSLAIGAGTAVLAAFFGTLMGLLAGFFKSLDAVLMRLVDAMMAFPDILLGIALVSILGASPVNVVLALTLVYTPRVARVVRASTLVIRELPYIEAAHAVGLSTPRLLFKHILPNLMSPILVHYLENLVRFALLAPVVLRDRPTAWTLWRQQWKYALIVGTVTPISYVLVLYAMQTAPLSLVAPAREVSMLFAAIIGGHLLGEGDRWLRVLGALLIAAGVAMLGLA